MKTLQIIIIITIASLSLIFGCTTEITESSSKSTSTKTIVKIEVLNISGIPQSGITVDLCTEEISDTNPTNIAKSVITGSNGIAVFDLESYITTTPKTLYFGVFKPYGNGYILSGKCTVQYLKKNTEYKTNLILLK